VFTVVKEIETMSLSKSNTFVVRAAAVGIAALLASAGTTFAQDVTRPGDPIVGFPVNWPAGEPPERAIDNTADNKYLNFAKLNTGFTVTPSGTGIVRGISIVSANDSPERDPVNFVLEGSNDAGATFVTIASGNLNTSTSRRALSQVLFPNSTVYGQYRVTFPTVRNPGSANSMQVAEVRLITRGNILSNGDPFTVTYSPGAFPGGAGGNENPTNLFDTRLGTKLGVDGGTLGPTIFDVTPALGASIVTSATVFGAADDAAFQNRTPTYITISGSNDGIIFTEIATSPLAQLNVNFSDQEITFPNTVSYTNFRVELGPCPANASNGFLQVGELLLSGINAPAAPTNDTCAGATTVTAGTISASNFNSSGTDITDCGNNDINDVWFTYTAAASGRVEVNTIGIGTLDTTLAVFDGCGGPVLGCNDNVRQRKSRVTWTAVAGRPYKIRVAGADATTGTFALTIIPNPAVFTDVTVPLNYNFNGMVHAGEAGLPDAPNGFRSIADRALVLTGDADSFEIALEGALAMPYAVVTQPGVFDLVHLGNRNTVDGGFYAFDTIGPGNLDDLFVGGVPTANYRGVQPAWLPNSDQGSTPQTTDLTGLNLAMGADTKIGMLYHSSNGGTFFDVALTFTDETTGFYRVNAPDWFGSQNPQPPFAGVDLQVQVGTYAGTNNIDRADPDVDLNVVEAVFSTAGSITAGIGDFTGKRLASIAFSGASNGRAGTAVFAVTVRDGVPVAPACLADVNADGVVDGGDFTAFINSFGVGDSTVDPVADVNLDNVIDGNDFVAFINAFGAGC